MADVVQVKASVPRDLKCRAFAALALRDEKFNRWLERQLEELLKEDQTQQVVSHAFPLPVPQEGSCDEE
jgi:hypothetical protein